MIDVESDMPELPEALRWHVGDQTSKSGEVPLQLHRKRVGEPYWRLVMVVWTRPEPLPLLKSAKGLLADYRAERPDDWARDCVNTLPDGFAL